MVYSILVKLQCEWQHNCCIDRFAILLGVDHRNLALIAGIVCGVDINIVWSIEWVLVSEYDVAT